jgi:hypothetical protein
VFRVFDCIDEKSNGLSADWKVGVWLPKQVWLLDFVAVNLQASNPRRVLTIINLSARFDFTSYKER